YNHPHHRDSGRRSCTVRGQDALVGLGERRLSARGARRPRRQPPVDAEGVEPVVAARQHAHLLPALELGEADGALRPRRPGQLEPGGVRQARERLGPPVPAAAPSTRARSRLMQAAAGA
uniref:Uncharacterized protein n=1 Tax=Triticum urartu TaxID=4572 RepID=A0A8R7K184_TRIUA